MAIAKIDANLCAREEECVASLSCPIGAINRISDNNNPGLAVVDVKRCLGCGKCIRFCPAKAVSME